MTALEQPGALPARRADAIFAFAMSTAARPPRHLRPLATVLAVMTLGTGGCFIRAARDPMPFVAHAPLGPEKARGVIVLLPGFGDQPKDFDAHGFVRILQQRAPGFDIVAADAHYGYYRTATVITQLHDHVIGPLVQRGYRQIWLAGVSMGGHGAVAYARTHPERITGLMLFAPHMGPGDTVKTVNDAGGICSWPVPVRREDGRAGFAQANFAWLKHVMCRKPPGVQLFVGVGDKDIGASYLLSSLVDPSHTVILPGGHNWDVWVPALDLLAQRAFVEGPAHATR
jgi:pimeloyl-ACP methyl ester carboxylesterase